MTKEAATRVSPVAQPPVIPASITEPHFLFPELEKENAVRMLPSFRSAQEEAMDLSEEDKDDLP